MDTSLLKEKLISALVSYFGLDFVTKMLAKMPNLDAKKQALIITALGALLSMLKQKGGKEDLKAKVIDNASDNILFAGLSMLLPTVMQKTLPAEAGAGVTGYNWTPNSYISQNPNLWKAQNYIGAMDNIFQNGNYINCPPNMYEMQKMMQIEQAKSLLEAGESLADGNGNIIYTKPLGNANNMFSACAV